MFVTTVAHNQIHGQGVLRTPLASYSGNWNCLLKSGYGQIIYLVGVDGLPAPEGKQGVWSYDKIFTDKDAEIKELKVKLPTQQLI